MVSVMLRCTFKLHICLQWTRASILPSLSWLMILLHMHLKLEEFHFLMIIFFICTISEGMLLCPGQNPVREELDCRWLLTPPTHHRSPEGHPMWCWCSPGKWLSAGPTPTFQRRAGMELGRKGTTKKVMLALAFHILKELRIVMPLLGVIAKYRAWHASRTQHSSTLNLPNGTGYLSSRTFPWMPSHLQRTSLQVASSQECMQCFQTIQFFLGLMFSLSFQPLWKSEFSLHAHNFGWSPPEAKPCSQTASGTCMGICRRSE